MDKVYPVVAMVAILYGGLTDSLDVLMVACTLLILVEMDLPRSRCRDDHTEGTP